MEQVVIINLHNNLFHQYTNLEGFYNYKCESEIILDKIKKKLSYYYYYNASSVIVWPICHDNVNIISSDYEFISPKLEKRSKDYHFIELCIKENEFKFYNFDESLVYDIVTPEEFKLHSSFDKPSNTYYFLIYKFLLLTMTNRPSNIKSALS